MSVEAPSSSSKPSKRRAIATSGAALRWRFWRRLRTARAGGRDPLFLLADAPHRRAQPRRPPRAAGRLPLSQPVPRRHHRCAGAEPADAGRDHRGRHRGFGDRRRPTRSPSIRKSCCSSLRRRRRGHRATSRPSLEFSIDPERVGPVLRRLVSPTRTRARIYDRDGYCCSIRVSHRPRRILRHDLPPQSEDAGNWLDRVWAAMKRSLRL